MTGEKLGEMLPVKVREHALVDTNPPISRSAGYFS
jgi:hypothetical protein